MLRKMSTETTTIDEYLSGSAKEAQKILTEFRNRIQKLVPEAKETISYGLPAFKLNGKSLVYFAAFKNHIGFFPTGSGVAAFQKELVNYETSKGTIRFPYDKPIPWDLVERIVKFRVEEVSRKKS